jgi:chemotaxis response regulator CheB
MSERRPAYSYLGSMPHARRRRLVRFRRWRVLVVEDDDSFAQALRKLLEADGRLEVAGTALEGREAVELAEALRPDVVVMDIVLPVMDGVEATREIRRRQLTIPVVGITGLTLTRAGSAQISSKSLSLQRVAAGVACAAAERAAGQPTRRLRRARRF